MDDLCAIYTERECGSLGTGMDRKRMRLLFVLNVRGVSGYVPLMGTSIYSFFFSNRGSRHFDGAGLCLIAILTMEDFRLIRSSKSSPTRSIQRGACFTPFDIPPPWTD